MDRRDFIFGIAGVCTGCVLFKTFADFNIPAKKENEYVFSGFNIKIAAHCNLNCKGCDSYSPLAKPEFVDYAQYVKDLNKLMKLAKGRRLDIGYLGGEPLLHPEITKIMDSSCKINPNGDHTIITNAVNLNSMDDEFWRVLKKGKIHLFITKYPVNIDRSFYEKKAAEYGVPIVYYLIISSKKMFDYKTQKVIGNNPDYKGDKSEWLWDKNLVDLKGEQDYTEKKNNCSHAGTSRFPVYDQGCIYFCSLHSYIKAFRDYFNIDIKLTDKDYIRIADIKSINEIDEFLSGPQPMCRFCKRCHDSCFGGKCVDWGFSERSISEWT